METGLPGFFCCNLSCFFLYLTAVVSQRYEARDRTLMHSKAVAGCQGGPAWLVSDADMTPGDVPKW